MSEIRKTHLANSVEVAEAKSQLDENAKHVLGNKQVLAWIVKYICRRDFGIPIYVYIRENIFLPIILRCWKVKRILEIL